MQNDPAAKPQSARLDEVERLLAESGHDLPVARARVAVARSGVALGFPRDPILHLSWWALSAVAGVVGALALLRRRRRR
jgi:hypothetical protein